MTSLDLGFRVQNYISCGVDIHCKTCILGLKWAVVKFPNAPIQLPFIISCPWCIFVALGFMYRGNLVFPRKNYFLLWMVERMNGDQQTATVNHHAEHDSLLLSAGNLTRVSNGSHHQSIQSIQLAPPSPIGENMHFSGNNYFNMEMMHAGLRECVDLFIRITAKFPLVIIFLIVYMLSLQALPF